MSERGCGAQPHFPKNMDFGYPAAATLGFISGGVPGAVGAAEIFGAYRKYFPQNSTSMPPTRRGSVAKRVRERRGTFTQSAARKSIAGTRTSVQTFKRSRSRSVSRARNTVNKRASVTFDDYHAGGIRKGKTGGNKRQKVAKLKPDVKRAIKKLLMPGAITGRFHKKVVSRLWFGGTSSFGGSFDNKQKVEYLSVPFAFSPASIMEAASILWNNKPAPGSSIPVYDIATDFTKEGFRVGVIDSSCVVTLRNNSKRAYKMRLFNSQPKKCTDIEPLGDLSGQLAELDEGTNPQNSGGNVFSVNREKLGLHPNLVPGFTRNWQSEIVELILQPGQTYVWTVQGPRNLEVDFNKFLNGGNYIEQQKFMRYMWVIYHTDLISTIGSGGSEGQPGYFAEVGDINATQYDGHGVSVDQTFHYHMKMPEQAGFQFTTTAVGATQEQRLNKRRQALAYLDYIPGPVGAIVRVDDEAGGALSQN